MAMNPYYIWLTNYGTTVIETAFISGQNAGLTRIALGDGEYSAAAGDLPIGQDANGGNVYGPAQSQTQLRNEVHRADITAIQKVPTPNGDDPERISIRLTINSDVAPLEFSEVAVFEEDGPAQAPSNAVLIGQIVKQSITPASDGQADVFELELLANVGRADSVTLIQDNSTGANATQVAQINESERRLNGGVLMFAPVASAENIQPVQQAQLDDGITNGMVGGREYYFNATRAGADADEAAGEIAANTDAGGVDGVWESLSESGLPMDGSDYMKGVYREYSDSLDSLDLRGTVRLSNLPPDSPVGGTGYRKYVFNTGWNVDNNAVFSSKIHGAKRNRTVEELSRVAFEFQYNHVPAQTAAYAAAFSLSNAAELLNSFFWSYSALSNLLTIWFEADGFPENGTGYYQIEHITSLGRFEGDPSRTALVSTESLDESTYATETATANQVTLTKGSGHRTHQFDLPDGDNSQISIQPTFSFIASGQATQRFIKISIPPWIEQVPRTSVASIPLMISYPRPGNSNIHSTQFGRLNFGVHNNGTIVEPKVFDLEGLEVYVGYDINDGAVIYLEYTGAQPDLDSPFDVTITSVGFNGLVTHEPVRSDAEAWYKSWVAEELIQAVFDAEKASATEAVVVAPEDLSGLVQKSGDTMTGPLRQELSTGGSVSGRELLTAKVYDTNTKTVAGLRVFPSGDGDGDVRPHIRIYGEVLVASVGLSYVDVALMAYYQASSDNLSVYYVDNKSNHVEVEIVTVDGEDGFHVLLSAESGNDLGFTGLYVDTLYDPIISLLPATYEWVNDPEITPSQTVGPFAPYRPKQLNIPAKTTALTVAELQLQIDALKDALSAAGHNQL